MSNELAVVKFSNGDIFFSAYHGCGSSVNAVLRSDVASVLADPFPEPEWDEWLANAKPEDSPNDFYKSQAELIYQDEEEVEIFTVYGGGEYWKAFASRSAKRITKCFSSDNAIEHVPEWAHGLFPELNRVRGCV